MQANNKTGDIHYATFGEGISQVTIRTDYLTDGLSIKTFVGGHYNSTLSRNFLHHAVQSARVFYGHIKDAAKAGKAVYQIEWEIEALIAASVAVDVEQVAADINADADERQAATEAIHNALVAAKDEIMADADPNWRANLRKQVVAHANQNMGRFAQARTTRPANLTPAQHTIVTLAANNGGRIVRGGQPGQATSSQILALEACGLADITYSRVGGTRAITGAQLTAKGFKYASVELGSAA